MILSPPGEPRRVAYLYLLPGASYHRVAQYARDEGRHFGIKEHALRKALEEDGLLVSDEGRHTTRMMVDGQPLRLLRLRRADAEKVWKHLTESGQSRVTTVSEG